MAASSSMVASSYEPVSPRERPPRVAAHGGLPWTDPKALRKTWRDRAVELCVRQGKTQREAAETLGVSEKTVSRYLRESGIPPRALRHVSPDEREARRDLVVELYVRRKMSQRAAARELGVSETVVRNDLGARGVKGRSRVSGLRPKTREQMAALRDAQRENVKRVKAERGLIGVHEVIKRLRRAGMPRGRQAIRGHIRAGLLAPEVGVGGFRDLLFTKASVDEYIARLRDHPDERYRRFENIPYRLEWIEAAHGREARIKASGRANIPLAAARGKKVGPPWQSDSKEQADVFKLREEGLSIREIAREVFSGESKASGRGKVARLLKNGPVT